MNTMSNANVSPQVQLSDIEALLAQFERWACITSAFSLILTLSAYGILAGMHP